MLVRVVSLWGILSLCVWSFGCAGPRRVGLAERTGGSAALFGQFQAYDGRSGRPISFGEVARRCAEADVVLFGEQHSDVVCNQLEAQLLHALASERRPVTLAMEFFEADTQAALDAYVTGKTEEAAFREQTRQGRAYILAHRPLLELCRAAGIPVLAANAPRRLVRAYRRSGLDYDAWRATVDPKDQRWLPTRNEYLSGPYEERFAKMMRGHGPARMPKTPATPPTTRAAATVPTSLPASAPAMPPKSGPVATAPATTRPAEAPYPPPVSQPVGKMPGGRGAKGFYQAQLLWDAAMAESLANFREHFPSQRVMLIVGVFHVARQGGTATKFRQRRPGDRICTLVYRGTTDGGFDFNEDDRNAGDVVIYGIVPPPTRKRPMKPTTMPATMPTATAPAGTAPATAPATAPTTRPASAPAGDDAENGR